MNEFYKIASAGKLLQRLKDSPEFRKAVLKSSILGAGTGAAAGVIGGGDESMVKKIMRGAAIGGVGGGITGAVYPGWFGPGNHTAEGEVAKKLSWWRRGKR